MILQAYIMLIFNLALFCSQCFLMVCAVKFAFVDADYLSAFFYVMIGSVCRLFYFDWPEFADAEQSKQGDQ